MQYVVVYLAPCGHLATAWLHVWRSADRDQPRLAGDDDDDDDEEEELEEKEWVRTRSIDVPVSS